MSNIYSLQVFKIDYQLQPVLSKNFFPSLILSLLPLSRSEQIHRGKKSTKISIERNKIVKSFAGLVEER